MDTTNKTTAAQISHFRAGSKPVEIVRETATQITVRVVGTTTLRRFNRRNNREIGACSPYWVLDMAVQAAK